MIRQTLTAIVLGLASAPVAAGDLTVRITGADSSAGTIVACLWRDPAGFPDCVRHTPLDRRTVPAARDVTVTFAGLDAGSYAVSVFHDANGNGKLDTNFVGIPREQLGMSNNPKFGIGAPPFSAAAFIVSPGQAIEVHLRNAL